MADGVDIDLYDIEDGFDQDNEVTQDDDLYNDVITASSSSERIEHGEGDTSSKSISISVPPGYTGRRISLYIGNLTWWTTDQDLTDAIASVGVTDLVEIKFYENRANGQSKGFAVVVVGSDSSSRIIFEKLARKEIHGQVPAVTHCNRQALSQFEAQARKGDASPQNGESKPFSNDNRNQKGPPGGGPPPQRMPPGGPKTGGLPPRNQRPPMPGPPPAGPPHPGPPPGGPMPPFGGGPPRPQGPPTGPPPPMGMPPGPFPPRGPGGPPPMMRGPPPHPGPIRGPPPPDPRGPPPRPEWDRPPGMMAVCVGPGQPPPPGIPYPPVGPPPPQPVPPPGARPPPGPGLPPVQPPLSIPPPGHPQAPAPHVNPAFFPPQHGQPPPGAMPVHSTPDLYNRPPPAVTSYPTEHYSRPPPERVEPSSPALSEQEFEEIFQRNKTVSSSAISRAVQDASAGEFASAIETLVTAISLIKQSKIASDDRCKILISSLQDTLHGIEEKSYGSKNTTRRSRSRERDRDRDREKRSRHRSRSRDREYRERSRDRERHYEESRSHRERDRDRDRDREREREYSSRRH